MTENFLSIAPAKEGKGRTFTVALLGYICANSLWELGGAGNAERPVWIAFGGSESEVRAVWANLMTGRRADGRSHQHNFKPDKHFEFLKSAGYVFASQKMQGAQTTEVICTAYLPSLFLIDPGLVDPKAISFIAMLGERFVDVPESQIQACVQHIRSLKILPESEKLHEKLVWAAKMAPLVRAYLDRRTRGPIIEDPRFHMQLLVALLRVGLAAPESGATKDIFGNTLQSTDRQSFHSMDGFGWERLGYLNPIAVHCDHDAFEALLAAESKTFFESKAWHA